MGLGFVDDFSGNFVRKGTIVNIDLDSNVIFVYINNEFDLFYSYDEYYNIIISELRLDKINKILYLLNK